MDDEQYLDGLIDTVGPVLGIAVQPEWRAAVRTHLAISLEHARAVAGFALADDAEAAPVFRA